MSNDQTLLCFATIITHRDKVWTISDLIDTKNHKVIDSVKRAIESLYSYFNSDLCDLHRSKPIDEIKKQYLKFGVIPIREWIEQICVKRNTFWDHHYYKMVFSPNIHAWVRLCQLFGENMVLGIADENRDNYEWFIQVIFNCRDHIFNVICSKHLTNLTWEYVGWPNMLQDSLRASVNVSVTVTDVFRKANLI